MKDIFNKTLKHQSRSKSKGGDSKRSTPKNYKKEINNFEFNEKLL